MKDMNDLYIALVLTIMIFGLIGVLRGLGRPRQRAGFVGLHNAAINQTCCFGPDTIASPGMVRCTMTADNIVVYDFELLPETYLILARNMQESAHSIRELVHG